MKYFVITFIASLFIGSCMLKTKENSFQNDIYLVNNGGCVYKDTVQIESIGNNLFKDKSGNLYFKTTDNSQEGKPMPLLISRLYNSCEGDSTYDLSRNIDSKTFRNLGYNQYKDKKNVFFYQEMLDGGNIIISGADAKTYTVIPHSFYGKDIANVYYQGHKVTIADPASFEGVFKIIKTKMDLTQYSGMLKIQNIIMMEAILVARK